jgi:hypothetical protein
MLARIADQLLALGHVVVGKTRIKLGLKSKPDGWRRVVGVGLRNEASKFAVAAFGLAPPKVDGIPAALARFLRTEPDAKFALTHTDRLTARYPIDHVDLVELHFAPDGSLVEIVPHLDPLREVSEVDRERIGSAVIAAYNRTRTRPEAVRPIELERLVHQELTDTAERAFAKRLVSAVCVVVEASDPAARFTPPEFRTRRGLGFGHLTFVINVIDETVDVWALAHHTGTDGAPLQEMMTRLRSAWASDTVVSFPEPDDRPAEPRRCSVDVERDAYETLTFHDFGELLALRKRLNTQYGSQIHGGISFGCVLMWLLAREPEFRAAKFGTTVDVPGIGTSQRDVDIVAIRPGEFASGADEWAGIVEFANVYQRGVTAARTRTSATRASMATAELLPPGLHRRVLESNPGHVTDTFGTVGLSILKDTEVFVAPFSDTGFPGGFIAVGGVGLPTEYGRTVGAVSVKGTREQAATYPEVVRRALAKLARREVVAA